MNKIAVNPETNEVVEFDGTTWKPVDKSRIAKDPSGKIAVYDGYNWNVVGENQARPAFTGSGLGRSALLGTRQLIEGAASPFTMVGDATNALLNLPIKGTNALLGTDIPQLGMPSQGLNQALVNQVGFPTEQNNFERMGGAINRAAGGAMTTMGLAAPLTSSMGASPEISAALTTNPGSQVIGAVTGGAAAEGTRQGLEDKRIFDNETADTVAKGFLQLLAGFAGGTGGYLASRGVVNAGQSIKNTAQGIANMLTQGGREKIAGQLLREASGSPDTLASRLSSADATSPVPGVKPTTAQALGGDTQISSLELAMRNDPAYRQAFDVRAAENQAARTGAIDAMIPAGAGSVDDLANGIRQAWLQTDDAGRQAILEAQQRAQQRIASLGQNIDQQAAGQIIREELQTAYDSARQQTNAAYRSIDPGNTSSFAGQQVYDRVAPLIEQYFANSTAGTPDDLIPILQRLRNSPNLTLAQIDAIRSDLGNIAGRAIQSGDRRLSSVASQMADDIGSYIDESAATGQGFSPEQAAAYQEARTLRRQQGDTFERGAVGATLKRGQFGEQSPASTVPADLFFRGGGSPEAAQQFIAAAGGRPRALQAAQNYLSTMLRQNVTAADGTIDPARLARFQNDYSGALQAFPELRAGIQNVADAQAVVDQATLTQTARQAEMAGSPLNQFLTKNPTDAVATILKSQNSQAAVGRVMEQLRDNPASLAAFKRSVVEWFRGSIENAGVQPVSGEPFQSFAKLKSIMDNKLPTLRQIFTPAEIDVMQAFADQMGQEARVMGSKPLGSNTFANLASRYLVDRATNSIAPMTGKNVSSMTPGLSWLLRGTDVSIRDAINNALLNPGAASRMVEAASKIPTNSPVMALVALKRGLTGQLGIQAVNSGQQNINLPPQIVDFLDRLQNPIPPKE